MNISSMNTETDALIIAEKVSLQYAGESVLDNIDFRIEQNEIVTILGPNGSGKSTFVKILVGALQPDSGEIRKSAGLRVGYVPQRLSLDANLPMTVRRFLDLGTNASTELKVNWVERVGVGHLMRTQVANLSGGQLQRVMLTHALLSDPHVLVLDEATQGLDQQGEAAFYRLIDEVRNEQGCAVVLVSHDLHVVMSASDRVVCLNGHVCCEGTPTIVSAAPEYRALFGLGTEGALALYRHDHDHSHDDHNHNHRQDNEHHGCSHDQHESGDADALEQNPLKKSSPESERNA